MILLADERGEIARRLPIYENAILDQRPALGGHAFVVVRDGGESVRLGAVAVEISYFGTELEFAGFVRGKKAGAGVIGFP